MNVNANYVNVNVNVNVGVRGTVSARVSVSVNVCRESFKCASSGAGGAGRGPCAGWSERRWGTVPLRVALCVQANRNDIPDRRLGTAAVRVRGVRFACEAPRTGWNGTKGPKTTSDPADLAKSANW